MKQKQIRLNVRQVWRESRQTGKRTGHYSYTCITADPPATATHIIRRYQHSWILNRSCLCRPVSSTLKPQTGPDHFHYTMVSKQFWSKWAIENGRRVNLALKVKGRPIKRRPLHSVNRDMASEMQRRRRTRAKNQKCKKRYF